MDNWQTGVISWKYWTRHDFPSRNCYHRKTHEGLRRKGQNLVLLVALQHKAHQSHVSEVQIWVPLPLMDYYNQFDAFDMVSHMETRTIHPFQMFSQNAYDYSPIRTYFPARPVLPYNSSVFYQGRQHYPLFPSTYDVLPRSRVSHFPKYEPYIKAITNIMGISFLDFHALVKREHELYESWLDINARTCQTSNRQLSSKFEQAQSWW